MIFVLLYAACGSLVIFAVFVLVEHAFFFRSRERLRDLSFARTFKKMMMFRRAEFLEADHVMRAIIFVVAGGTLMVVMGPPQFRDPADIFFQRTGLQPYIARFESEDFHTNISDVKYEEVFEAEERGVGYQEGNIGENVIDLDASSQRARWIRPHRNRVGGTLSESTIGANFAPGQYQVMFRLRTDRTEFHGPLLRLIAYDTQKKKALAQRAVTYGDFDETLVYQMFPVSFHIDRLQPVVFKVVYEHDAKAQVWHDNIEIQSQEEAHIIFERDKYYPTVFDKDATGGRARYAAAFSPAGHAMFGIETKAITFGEYEARFRLKAGDNTKDEVMARIEVVDNQNPSDLYKHQEIKSSDFNASGVYQDFTVPFFQKGKRELDFRVFTTSSVGLWVDGVTIFPRAAQQSQGQS